MTTVLLKRLYALVFIEHGTRRPHLAGVTARPTGAWVVRQARDLGTIRRRPVVAGVISEYYPAA